MGIFSYLGLILPAAGIAVELFTAKAYRSLPRGTLYVPSICRFCWHIIGLAFAIIGIMPAALSPKNAQTLWALMQLCMLLIEIPAWMSRRYRAAIRKDILYVTPYWGKSRSLPLSQIDRIFRSKRYDVLNICSEGKLFCRVPGICVGYKEFRQTLEERGLLPCWK